MLTITTLGGLSIRRDGEPVTDFASRKVEALLVYVASAERAQSREVLAEMLWEERTQRQSLGNLRVALSSLRKHLTPYVLITRDTVVINPEAQVWLDAAELEAKLAQAQDPAVRITPEMAAQIEEAVALYRGDFLQGFYVRDSAAFEDWMGRERERLHRLVVGALPRLVAHRLEVGDYPAGMRYAARLLELDPLMEEAHRQMMRLLAYSGQRGAALEQYETCRGILERELGVEPVEETAALYEQIVAGKVGPPAAVLAEEEEIPPAPGEPPFKGLQFFDVADADLFFGREMLTARLVERLREERLLAVVGASGSGKSSLVRAGLVPALQRGQPVADGTQPPQGSERWEVHILTPTAHPLEALALSLTRGADSVQAAATLMDDLAADPRSLHLYARQRVRRGNRLLLVVDQFEELFALCRDPEERRAFVDNLLTAADPDVGGPTVVVLTLRADFYHHCAQYDNLREALETYQAYIGSMTPQELRRAIEEPARRNDWEFEPGLVGLLLHDVGDEPGALPLLSHALLETWKRRRGRMMTLAGYTGAGRVQSAIAQSAEAVYQGLEEEEQAIARSIFLRLTELGEGTQDTRRQAGLDELVTRPEEATAVEGVLSTLVEARLVTAEEETVQVAHEALIREWPTLREWLEEDREGLRVHRHLTEAAQEWQRMGRDPGELYRGGRLAQALEWVKEHTDELNPLEREFLAASEEWAQRREAERAQRRRRIFVGLATGLLVALVLAVTAALGWRSSATSENALGTQVVVRETAVSDAEAEANLRATAEALAVQEREAAVAEADLRATAEVVALEQREEARREASVGLAAQALLELEGFYSERAVPLALEALENYPYTWQAERALGQAVLGSRLHLILQHGAGVWVRGVWWLPDGTLILTAGNDGIAKMWDTSTGEEILTLSGHKDTIFDAAWSPSGDRIVTASWDGTAKVWDASTGAQVFTLSGHTDGVYRARWSPSGDRIATASSDGTAKIWDAATGEMLLDLVHGEDMVNDAQWSADGAYILTPSDDRTAVVWDTVTGERLLALEGHEDWVQHALWSPSGDRIVTGSMDGTAKVWDVSALRQTPGPDSQGLEAQDDAAPALKEAGRLDTGAITGTELFTLSGHWTHEVRVAWSPSGDRIATAGDEGIARIWDASTGANIHTCSGHTGSIRALAWSPDGTRLATASLDATAKIWDTNTGREIITLLGHFDVYRAVWSPLGDRIATAGLEGTVKVWGLDPSLLTIAGDPVEAGAGLAWSPQGDRVVRGSPYGTVKVWDISALRPVPCPQSPELRIDSAEARDTGEGPLVLSGHGTAVPGADWSPSGDRIVTASYDRTVRLWDATSGEELDVFDFGDVAEAIYGVDWSPDGTRIACTMGLEGVGVLDAETGETLLRFAREPDMIIELEWSPDGTAILTTDMDGIILLWDATTGQLIQNLYPEGFGRELLLVTSWSPDGRRLVTLTPDGITRIWDAITGETLMTFEGHTAYWDIRWSRIGERILTAGADGTARVWDADAGVELLRYDVGGTVAGADWSPDGRYVFTAGEDGMLKVFPAWQTLEELMDYAKECWVIRELTAEERELFELAPR